MSFSTYYSYKDSHVDWLGQVPSNWEVRLARRLFQQIREPAHDSDEQLSATQRYGVVPQKLFMELEDQKVVLALAGLGNFKHLEKDDFVISLRSFQGGIEHSAYSGCVSPAYTVLRPVNDVFPRYFAYALKCSAFVSALQTTTDGIRDGKSISYEQFGTISLPLPSLPEQSIIADFLDRETAKIDALVEEQKRLIELLKEKRHAVISHAVTKGLKPDVRMKNSGVEWLGKVPEHWTVSRVKVLTELISKGTTPTTVGAEFESSGVRFLKAENIVDDRIADDPDFFISDETHRVLARSDLKAGDVLVVIAGATTGKSAVLPAELLPANTNQAVAFVRPFDVGWSRYIQLWLSSEAAQKRIKLGSVQSAQPNLAMEDLGNLPILCPPAEERDVIVSAIAQRTAELDHFAHTANRSIALFQERRAALISAAVTGKIDVREAAAAQVMA